MAVGVDHRMAEAVMNLLGFGFSVGRHRQPSVPAQPYARRIETTN
jgi:hypothetical protein